MKKSIKNLSALCALPLLGSMACTTTPLLDEGLAPDETGVISGDVIILVPLEEAHPVVLYLSHVMVSDDGQVSYPLANITVIPAQELTQGDDPGAARTGSFTLSRVEPGSYVLTGIVDVDENFNPLLPQEEPQNNPDLDGGYANVGTGSPVFEIAAGQVASEINVIFSVPAQVGSGEGTPTEVPPTPTASLPTPTEEVTEAPTPTLLASTEATMTPEETSAASPSQSPSATATPEEGSASPTTSPSL